MNLVLCKCRPFSYHLILLALLFLLQIARMFEIVTLDCKWFWKKKIKWVHFGNTWQFLTRQKSPECSCYFFLLESCSCSCDDDLVLQLTNTSSASIVCVLMASVTLSATNSWFTGALAGGLVTNATITVQCVGKHTLTA